jgi:dTDP-4-dehydrorhamnose reductase
LRLASLFGGVGVGAHQATIDRIADNLITGLPVRAFVDRTVSPSYAVDVARATRALIEKNAMYGTYHCVSAGFATWHDLATEVAVRLGTSVDVLPSVSSDSGTGARRPRFCALSNRRLLALGIDMPTWQSAVERHLAARCAKVPAASAPYLHYR